MPLPVAHGLVGAGIAAALSPQLRTNRHLWLLFAGALLANAADFDFLLVLVLDSRQWHRGFSHSIAFALLVFICSALFLGRSRLREAVVCGLTFASHGVLDYVTSKTGGGVELFWPFSRDRLILGWWGLSEEPSKLTRVEILEALALEFALFAPLFLTVVLLRRALASRMDSPRGAR